jgi:peroxiredoxin
VGKLREKDFIGSLYARRDFTLVDDQGKFFTLSELPERELLLLIFTPDGISPRTVAPFRAFGQHLPEFTRQGVRVALVSRTNREIARNFKAAAHFTSRLLIDTSGTVGRLIGIWPTGMAADYWGYALVDREMNVYWAKTEQQPMSFERVQEEFRKLRALSGGEGAANSASKPTLSDSP